MILDTKNVGGPSAGLGLALAIVDLLTPGELTGGRRVAVTGAISPDGRVEPVGGIVHKTRAAAAADAEVLIVPTANYDEAKAVAGHLRVVAVDSLDDALDALERVGGDRATLGGG